MGVVAGRRSGLFLCRGLIRRFAFGWGLFGRRLFGGRLLSRIRWRSLHHRRGGCRGRRFRDVGGDGHRRGVACGLHQRRIDPPLLSSGQQHLPPIRLWVLASNLYRCAGIERTDDGIGCARPAAYVQRRRRLGHRIGYGGLGGRGGDLRRGDRGGHSVGDDVRFPRRRRGGGCTCLSVVLCAGHRGERDRGHARLGYGFHRGQRRVDQEIVLGGIIHQGA